MSPSPFATPGRVCRRISSTLFTPFVTTKSHGLGIGLTIVRTIVDAHGGTIGAHNNPEGGATFTVTLPAAKRPRSCQNRQPTRDGSCSLSYRNDL